MKVLVTGAAGFIGHHVALRLLARGDHVIGMDDLNGYYSVALKQARLARLEHKRFELVLGDISDPSAVARAFSAGGGQRVERVVHLAAQVGVRHSIQHPEMYVRANLVGFSNVIEAARRHDVEHFVYASSSSVYGANTTLPFCESQPTDHPLSLYAATKKSNELVARSYSHLFALPTTGLRLFTVYGPWGRPDMAFFQFTESILNGRPIRLFAEGRLRRDFTYIDDVAAAFVDLLDRPASSQVPARILDVGSHESVEVRHLVALLEAEIGRKAVLEFHPMQDGDMMNTQADLSALTEALGPRVSTPLEAGVPRFVQWYRDDYGGRVDDGERSLSQSPTTSTTADLSDAAQVCSHAAIAASRPVEPREQRSVASGEQQLRRQPRRPASSSPLGRVRDTADDGCGGDVEALCINYATVVHPRELR